MKIILMYFHIKQKYHKFFLEFTFKLLKSIVFLILIVIFIIEIKNINQKLIILYFHKSIY